MNIVPWEDFALSEDYTNASIAQKRKYKKEYWADLKANQKNKGVTLSKDDYRLFMKDAIALDKQIYSEQSRKEFSEQDRGVLKAAQEGVRGSILGGAAEFGLEFADDEQAQAVREAKDSVSYQYQPESFLEGVTYGSSSLVTDAPLLFAGGGIAGKSLQGGAKGSALWFKELAKRSPKLANVINRTVQGAGAMGMYEGLLGVKDIAQENIRREEQGIEPLPVGQKILHGGEKLAEGMGIGAVTGLVGAPFGLAKKAGMTVRNLILGGGETAAETAALVGLHAARGEEVTPESFARDLATAFVLKGLHNFPEASGKALKELAKRSEVKNLENIQEAVNGVMELSPEEVKDLTTKIDKIRNYKLEEQVKDVETKLIEGLTEKTGIPERIVDNAIKNKKIAEAIREFGTQDITPDKVKTLTKEEMMDVLGKKINREIGATELVINDLQKKLKNLELTEQQKNELMKRIGEEGINLELLYQGENYLLELPLEQFDPSFDFVDMSVDTIQKVVDHARAGSEGFPESRSLTKKAINTVSDFAVSRWGDAISRKSRNGAALAYLQKTVRERSEMLGGMFENDIRRSKIGLSESLKDLVRLRAIKPKQIDEIYKKRGLTQEQINKVEDVYKTHKEVFDSILELAKNSGIEVKEVLNYWPIIVKEKYIKTEAGRKELINDLVQDMVVVEDAIREELGANSVAVHEGGFMVDLKGQHVYREYSTKQRKEMIDKQLAKFISERERKTGHFMERKLGERIPEKYRETDVDATMSEYINRTTRRIVEAQHFGVKDEVIQRLTDGAVKELATNQNISREQAISDAKFIQNFAEMMMYKKGDNKTITEVVDNIMAAQVIRKMQLSPISQYLQRFAPIVHTQNIKSYLKATGWQIKSSKNKGMMKIYDPVKKEYYEFNALDFYNLSGSANTQILNDFLSVISGDSHGFLVRGSRKVLDWNRFKKFDADARYKAATIGVIEGMDLMSYFNKVLKSDVAKRMSPDQQIKLIKKNRKGERLLRRFQNNLGLDIKEVLAKGVNPEGQYYLSPQEFSSGARHLEVRTNFRTTFDTLPASFQSNAVRLMSQFQSYNYNRTIELKRAIYDEARKGNLRPLLYCLGTGLPLGTAAKAMRMLITGSLITSSFEDNKDYAYFLLDGLSTAGAFGMANTIFMSARYGRVMFGPTNDDLINITNAIKQTADKKEDKWTPLTRLAMKEIPIWGRTIEKKTFEKKPSLQTGSSRGGGRSSRSGRSAR